MQDNKSNAPWKPAEVESLNEYQAENIDTFIGENGRPLIATSEGWIESTVGGKPAGPRIVQTWAHDWMADGRWRCATRRDDGKAYALTDSPLPIERSAGGPDFDRMTHKEYDAFMRENRPKLAEVLAFDPSKVNITFGGIKIEGFATDDPIVVQRKPRDVTVDDVKAWDAAGAFARPAHARALIGLIEERDRLRQAIKYEKDFSDRESRKFYNQAEVYREEIERLRGVSPAGLSTDDKTGANK